MGGVDGDEELNLAAALETAEAIAREAGAEVGRQLSQPGKAVDFKGAVDLVTETDLAVEALIRARLRAAFPAHAFKGEEDTADAADLALGEYDFAPGRPSWCVDPIDGTTNFVHGFPICCVSIALLDARRAPVLGVIFNPARDELFKAARGLGATLNGVRIAVRAAPDAANLDRALVSTNYGQDRREEVVRFVAANVGRLLAHPVRGIRMTGSAALAMCDAACGRVDAFFEWGIHAWDIAAGAVIVHEAGGSVVSRTPGEKDAPLAELPLWTDFDVNARRVFCGHPGTVLSLLRVLDLNADSIPSFVN